MGLQLSIHRFTVQDFHRMAQAGIFTEDDRVELLDGEIIEMTPIGSRHAACVSRLTQVLSNRLANSVIVWVQNPVRLDQRSEPQPDVVLLRPRPDFYAPAHPGPEDVLLLIEVVDTTAQLDRQVKLPLYARARISEAWIVDVTNGMVEVYRQPEADGYQSKQRLLAADLLQPQAFPEFTLSVGEILP